MAEMEAEAMLLGIWKNFEELEENVNMDELNLIIKAAYEREHRNHKFAAALKGIKLDEPEQEDTETRFEKVQKRAQQRLAGMSEGEIALAEEVSELQDLGFSFSKE